MPKQHAQETIDSRGREGMRAALRAVAISAILGVMKVAAGVFGNSYALIADGMESILDLISAVVVWSGLRIAMKPPDSDHPYGHGKAESLAALSVSILLLGGAVLIAAKSIQEIVSPHLAPAPWTLIVLVVVVLVKEGIFRYLSRKGGQIDSSALVADAWHHRADALTSIAAFIGIFYVLAEQKETLRRWMPCSIGMGLGLVLPVAYDFAFFAGGFILWVICRRLLGLRDLTLTTIAVGCIVAEGLGGVLKPVLQMAGVIAGG